MTTNVWFTSDLHLGHQKVAELRGFDTVEEHDAAIIDAWHLTVRPVDSIWVLGDLSLKNPKLILPVLQQLPGEKHLVPGNHDPVHPMHRGAFKHQPAYMEVFASVQVFERRRISGHDVLMSHLPYDLDHTEEARFPQYRLPDLGAWLLHGHTHGPERVNGRQIHVGLDAWGLAPVNLDVITALIAERAHGD